MMLYETFDSKQELLEKIRMYDFILTELNLYLDTHPNCPRGLEHFRKYRQLREDAAEQYENRYGPITSDASKADGTWEWVAAPWPWENNGEV